MCGPCSDGTYWSDKSRDAYGYKPGEPSKYRCTGCHSPVNWCHCELSLDRIDIYYSESDSIKRKGDKNKNVYLGKNVSNN